MIVLKEIFRDLPERGGVGATVCQNSMPDNSTIGKDIYIYIYIFINLLTDLIDILVLI